jgi:hypothetical protein
MRGTGEGRERLSEAEHRTRTGNVVNATNHISHTHVRAKSVSPSARGLCRPLPYKTRPMRLGETSLPTISQ